MRPATASAAFVNHVLDVAEQHGCEGESLLATIGLPRERLSDPILRIPMHQLRALLALSASITGLPHFGLLVGAAVRPGTYGVLGYVSMTSATLGESMSMIRRFGKIVFDSPSSQTHIEINDGRVLVEDQRISELEPYCAFQQEAVLTGWTAFGRWLIASNHPVLAVTMRHPAMGDPAVYERFFGCPVQFGAKRNSLVFPASMLAMRVQGADPRTHKSLLLEATLQLGRSYAPLSVIGRLRALLVEQLPGGDFSLESLASHLAMSPRTLQRKLAVEGENFTQVLETMRMELADHHLRSTDASIMDIALTLGFSQASAFSHAFRQARGISPADFRKALHKQ
ncbi:AraC family transcriptional regulator [Pseudomonas sp. 14P_8.1_Bac3]|uniref:AraC family transcriptional regulator n=1 Tax=Pseudomonas sp. 14P_8.1_Bac3 TaxID=2971621 RepID=UPI0021CA10B5|nr:AraC family transcriptional regulator [Pseudomonas sp. 14P_8.1_Bac3]MCU1759815.1 AraC family transcriptional regulator [Pseudomonas sp. 14P_8.1_Bac3]